MCISFGRRSPTPVSTPSPIQPRQPDLVSAARLPSKKELLDPDDTAGVEYGTSAKKDDTRGRLREQVQTLLKSISTPVEPAAVSPED